MIVRSSVARSGFDRLLWTENTSEPTIAGMSPMNTKMIMSSITVTPEGERRRGF